MMKVWEYNNTYTIGYKPNYFRVQSIQISNYQYFLTSLQTVLLHLTLLSHPSMLTIWSI